MSLKTRKNSKIPDYKECSDPLLLVVSTSFIFKNELSYSDAGQIDKTERLLQRGHVRNKLTYLMRVGGLMNWLYLLERDWEE